MADDDDKKHDATPERREKYRKEGRFAKARDASAIAATAGALAAILGTREASGRAIDLLFARTLGDVDAISRGQTSDALHAAAGALVAIALPVAVAAVLAGVTAGFAQAGLRFDTDILGVKLERLNPVPGFQKLFSPKKAIVETAFALARIGAVGVVAYGSIKGALPDLLALSSLPLANAVSVLTTTVTALVLKIGGALTLLALADYAQSRFTLEKEMMMSTKELKEEMRGAEGDQKTKAKIRAKGRQLAKKRMMSDVKKADVVVTNPTHIAVALRYSGNDPAPVVLAKGHDEVALLIRAEARKHGIAILEARSLARALDAEVKVGEPIKGAHFAAVAQVLAFVYRLKAKKPAAPARGSQKASSTMVKRTPRA